jgi:hypothetical protein
VALPFGRSPAPKVFIYILDQEAKGKVGLPRDSHHLLSRGHPHSGDQLHNLYSPFDVDELGEVQPVSDNPLQVSGNELGLEAGNSQLARGETAVSPKASGGPASVFSPNLSSSNGADRPHCSFSQSGSSSTPQRTLDADVVELGLLFGTVSSEDSHPASPSDEGFRLDLQSAAASMPRSPVAIDAQVLCPIGPGQIWATASGIRGSSTTGNGTPQPLSYISM